MLRDYNISGRINLMEIPVLLHMLHFWKVRKGWTNVPVLRPVTGQGSSNKLKETKNFASLVFDRMTSSSKIVFRKLKH